MNLLKQGAIEAGTPLDRIFLISGEAEATAQGLSLARPGDLLVITPSDVEGSWKQVQDFDPRRSPAFTAEAVGAQ
jgi:cyanophycin synthetase